MDGKASKGCIKNFFLFPKGDGWRRTNDRNDVLVPVLGVENPKTMNQKEAEAKNLIKTGYRIKTVG
jgi:hypothetical protein